MKASKLLREVLALTLETLERLAETLFVPWSAARYFEVANLPPLKIGLDWSANVTALRQQVEQPDADTHVAELFSKVTSILDGLQLAIDTARGESTDLAAIDIGARLVLPALLWVLEENIGTSDALGYIATGLMAAIIIDERLQEAYPNTLMSDRWPKLIAAAADVLGATSSPEGWGSLFGAILSGLYYTPVFAKILRKGWDAIQGRGVRDPLDTLKWPFDMYAHKGFDEHPGIPGLEATMESAQHALVAFFGSPERKLTESDYKKFDDIAPLWRHRRLALALVPRTDTPGGTNGGVYVEARGDVKWSVVDGPGKGSNIDLAGGGGVLFPVGDPAVDKGVQALGTLGFDTQLLYESPDAAADDDPEGVTFHIRRVMVETGLTLATVEAACDVWARVRFEQVELGIGKVPVLEYVIPSGARFAFDAGVIVSLHRGVALEGGIGGEVVIPLDLAFDAKIAGHSLASARVRNVHVKLLATDTPDGRKRVIELTAGLSATLFGALTATVDGVGVAFGINPRDHRANGNLAGIADVSWETVPPTGIGVALDAWILKGGGFFLHDAAAHRIGGGIEIAIEKIASLKALGVAEPRPGGDGSSWLVVGAATFDLGWPAFSLKGLGMIYGSHRRADPDAFLASMATGGLDAILFPPDPIGNAASYLATLEHLFPPVAAGEVIGGMVSLEAFRSLITADIGLLLDRRPDATSWYLLARIRVRVPAGSGAAASFEADGVAIWDNTRNEFQLRLVLRNSKLFGGDVAGEIMVFRGDPDLDDHVDQHTTFVSLGGFHPAYTVPSGRIYVPKRLSMTWSQGDHIRFEWKFYLAVTPGSFQLGVSADLTARFSGFGIRGHMGFDAMFSSPTRWTITIEISVELMLGSRTFAGIGLKGALNGLSPASFTGRVKISFLFWSWTSPPFTIPLYSGGAEELATSVQALLETAVATAANFESGGAPGVSLRAVDRAGVWVSPSEPLRFRQHVAPLARTITRYGDSALPSPETFTITAAPAAGARWTSAPIDDEFAPVMYLDLTREQQLAARSFEAMPAGFEVQRELEVEPPVTIDLDYEEIVVDPDNIVPPRSFQLSSLLVAAVARLQLAPVSTRVPPRLRREQFAIVDGNLATVAHSLGYMQARTQAAAGELVVPATEVA